MKLRELFIKEQAQDEYVVMVILLDSSTRIRIPGIPLSVLRSENADERIREFVARKYPDAEMDDWFLVDREGRVTDIRSLSPKPDPEGELDPTTDEVPPGSGETPPEVDDTPPAQPQPPETEEPPQAPEPEERPESPATPSQPETPTDDEAPDVDTEIPPPPRAPENPEPQIPVEALPPEQQQQAPVQVTLISPEEFEQMLAASGGGEDGAEGEEGEEGESGSDAPSDGLTQSETESIPEITEALYEALKGGWAGFFTDEDTIFNELDKITRREHFDAISQSYEAMTGEALLDRLVLHFNREGAEPVERLNRIIGNFGYQLRGTTGAGLAGKLEHVDTGSDSTRDSEESVNITNEQQQQIDEANYIYTQIRDRFDAGEPFETMPRIEYTDTDGEIKFISAEQLGLTNDSDLNNAGVAGDLKFAIADLFPDISAAQGRSNSDGGPAVIEIDFGNFVPNSEDNN